MERRPKVLAVVVSAVLVAAFCLVVQGPEPSPTPSRLELDPADVKGPTLDASGVHRRVSPGGDAQRLTEEAGPETSQDDTLDGDDRLSALLARISTASDSERALGIDALRKYIDGLPPDVHWQRARTALVMAVVLSNEHGALDTVLDFMSDIAANWLVSTSPPLVRGGPLSASGLLSRTVRAFGPPGMGGGALWQDLRFAVVQLGAVPEGSERNGTSFRDALSMLVEKARSVATHALAPEDKRLADATASYLELSRDLAFGALGNRKGVNRAIEAFLRKYSDTALMEDLRYRRVVTYLREEVLPRTIQRGKELSPR